ncbi:MAG: tRNA glutamyl-Q(34) synthetase GluQRS [Fimbriimonadaceae bacterium]
METTRFAPSPTGYLHLGHVYAAQVAREHGSTMLLRIEDIDGTRATDTYAEAIFDDLRWLGVSWDGEVVRQSNRMDAYSSALRDLDSRGLVYPCFCTRKEILASVEAPQGPEAPIYPGTCKARTRTERKALIESGAQYALRLDIGACNLPQLHWEDADGTRHGTDSARIGDFVVARKETPTSYHLAVVIDDAFQEVTLVTRGRDLEDATHPQSVLQYLLGITPPRYLHHALVCDEAGRRLAKRDGDTAVRLLRERGWTPSRVWAEVERLLETA